MQNKNDVKTDYRETRVKKMNRTKGLQQNTFREYLDHHK